MSSNQNYIHIYTAKTIEITFKIKILQISTACLGNLWGTRKCCACGEGWRGVGVETCTEQVLEKGTWTTLGSQKIARNPKANIRKGSHQVALA